MVVQALMYCAEQIIVPEKLPNIMKNFAIDAIRTQPYDLLRWSAAYFRCKAMDEIPPIKVRLEKKQQYLKYLTKGYLKVLLKQIGKAFFVNKNVIFDKWGSLCLPEEELLKYLSLCRMLHYNEIHWLKLFAVMAGSLTDDFKSTIQMICELLTEELEGGPNPVPLWMFAECYKFIAKLDCSEKQEFEDGRKILSDGTLEDLEPLPNPPKVIYGKIFRDLILDETKYSAECSVQSDIDLVGDCECADDPHKTPPSEKLETISTLSSGFKFIGDLNDPYKVIGMTHDFDSIILLLHEAQGHSLQTYDGPSKITNKNIEHAKKREVELSEKRNSQAEICEKNAMQHIQNERLELLKKNGSPWSWLHQFASHNCREKSYNFIEEISIPSDESPGRSSGDSFDFEREQFIEGNVYSPRTESIDSCEVGVKEMLFKSLDDELREKAEKEKKEVEKTIDNIISNVINAITAAEVDGKLHVTSTESLISFLNSDPDIVDKLNLDKIRKILKKSEEDGFVFKNLDELYAYLQDKLKSDKDFNKCLCPDIDDKKPSKTNAGPIDDDIVESDTEEIVIVDEALQTKNSEKLNVDNGETVEKIPEQNETVNAERIEDIFIKCDIEIDPKIEQKKVPSDMIIGIIPVPPDNIESVLNKETDPPSQQNGKKDDGKEPSIPVDEQRQKVKEQSQKTIKELSSNVFTTALKPLTPKLQHKSQSETSQESSPPENLPTEPFLCTIPILPGIGKPMSKKTIHKFLTYLKYRSREEKGMIFPRHFKEEKCPNTLDCTSDEEDEDDEAEADEE